MTIHIPKDRGLMYLATPYSKYRGGICTAYIDACKVMAVLVRHGFPVYSPIAHTHGIAIHGGLDPYDHQLWMQFDEAMMAASKALVIAMLDGWGTSYGIQLERDTFRKAGKPEYFLNIEPQWLG